jgi:O-antigen/teichoic acid export membrane protein
LANAIFMAWYARSVRDFAGYFAAYGAVALAFATASIVVWRMPGLLADAEGGMWGRSLAWLIGALVAGGLLFRGDLRRIARELRPDRGLYRSSVWLAVAALLSGLSPLLPMLALSQVGTAEQLGWYSAAWQVQQVMLAGAAVLHMVFFPKIYREASTNRALASRSYRQMILVAAAASAATVAIFMLFSQTFMAAFFGNDYLPGSSALAIVTVGVGAVLLRYVAELRVMIDGRTSQIFVAAGISAAVCGVVSFLVASDAFRASIAYVIGELVYTISLVLMTGTASKPLLGLVAGFVCSAVAVLLVPNAIGIAAATLASAAALFLALPRISFEPGRPG